MFVAFDEDENVDIAGLPPFSPAQPFEDITPCMWESNRVDSADFVVADTGWLYLNFFLPFSQGFVSQLHRSGEFSVGYAGVALDSACNPNPLPLRE